MARRPIRTVQRERSIPMATTLVLGPSQDGWDEPAPAPPMPAGNVPVVFGSPAIQPGGLVNLLCGTPAENTTPVYPVLVHAVYIPKGQEAALVAGASAAAFLASSFPQGVVQVISAPATASNVGGFTVNVSGITPGLYFVQTVLEYPA